MITVLGCTAAMTAGKPLKICILVGRANMEGQAKVEAEVFIDCTYEGDLMAMAGVSYAWGRESRREYDTFQRFKMKHQNDWQSALRQSGQSSPADDTRN